MSVYVFCIFIKCCLIQKLLMAELRNFKHTLSLHDCLLKTLWCQNSKTVGIFILFKMVTIKHNVRDVFEFIKIFLISNLLSVNNISKTVTKKLMRLPYFQRSGVTRLRLSCSKFSKHTRFPTSACKSEPLSQNFLNN